ncbi:MAG: 30S ribosome-binding factor RbfA [Deltaproteobacteria bacterium]|nr:30S ribosome-binding factor RbfA [Deltaproteobacteria bacterium]
MEGRRASRVADEIRRRLGDILTRKVSDPRLAHLSITDVVVTKDLRIARIYYHVMPGEEGTRETVEKGIEKAAGFIKRELSSLLYLKYMPELEFRYDETIDKAERVETLLKELKEQNREEDNGG